MSRRFGGTGATAGRLNGVLRSGEAPDGSSLRDAALAGAGDVNIVLDAIVDAASPANGTQDGESSRRAVRDALTDLLDRYPDADLLALTDVQREFVIERYAALDVYGRFCLDVQKTIMAKAPDPATGLRRLRQVREFISQEISAAFRSIRKRSGPTTTANVSRLTARALHQTLSVFEDYIR
ncbi:Qat anti-phage system associated protein QatB [Actinoplanes sp. NPDC000266]